MCLRVLRPDRTDASQIKTRKHLVNQQEVEMRIRVIDTPPAPSMDGVEVGPDHIYDVDVLTAAYLLQTGFAVNADDESEHGAPSC